MKTRILIFMAMLLITQYGAEAQSEPEIIWHTPGVSADFLVLSPDGQYVYANRGDSKLGNVFSQLRVDDGTIIRKDVNTVGHIAGFTPDGRHAIVVNLRNIKNGNKIYKVETETLEKVDSLEFEDVLSFFTSFAFSYDNKYLYLGNKGWRTQGSKNRNNFYVVDTEIFEVVYSAIFVKHVPKTDFATGEVLGIYPSPNNDFVALNVNANIGDVLGSWLPVLDVRDNYKNIATNPAMEYPYSDDIGSAAFTMDNSKLFVCVGGSAFTGGIKKTLVYNTPTFILIDSLVFPSHPNYGGGSSSVRPSRINSDLVYIGSILPTSSGFNNSKLQKINANNLKEICSIKSEAEQYFQFIPTYILADNETNIIAFNQVVTNAEVEGIYKFKNCTPTSVEDDKNTIHTLQVIDNKLTIPIEESKGVLLNYQISDIRGVVVNQKSIILTSNELTIDVHHLVPGTYFLTLQILNETVNYKFVILR